MPAGRSRGAAPPQVSRAARLVGALGIYRAKRLRLLETDDAQHCDFRVGLLVPWVRLSQVLAAG